MYRIEKVGEACFYIKARGTLPPPVAEKFTEEFTAKTNDYYQFCLIVDIVDAILLDIHSFNTILDLLKQNNEKLLKSAFVISKNPPLDAEFKLLLEKANSPNRKIVETLEEAKEWVGIDDIIIEKK